MKSHAIISDCQKYRYSLSRIWNGDRPLLMFIMLNPSTADANVDDPTIRRCINFAARLGYGGIYVCNLFAFRATDPAQMIKSDDPIGPMNDWHIQETRKLCKDVVFAWGVNGTLFARDWDVIKKIQPAYCFGKTKGGNPKHPLYLPSNSQLIRF
ncbi:DUF1643 domain-containing protein [Larkinella sp. VNQ87]|uniref:DUF1643 domain-containing protein n=1 Tax=Larkinella sp. VNQ87 TaxID=3400921 RepID=UPI003C099997